MEYVIRIADHKFVRVYKDGRKWTTRVWANTATKFASYDEAFATRQYYNIEGKLYKTFDKGQTIAPCSM